MKLRHLKYPAAIAMAAALAGCGSQSNNNSTSASTTAPALIPVPGISSAVTYSFDLGQIDQATGMYYVTDRTNKAVDVINLNGGPNAAVQAGGVTLFKQAYAGCNSGGTTGGATNFPYVTMPGCLNIAITANATLVTNNDLDGPDGLDIVGPNLFVGDVNALWVVNKTTGVLVGKVAIPNTGTKQGFRSDEGCYDPVHHLYATALTGDPNFAFYTILDTTAHDADATGATMPVVIGQVIMNDNASAAAAGLEACAFDSAGGFMYLNNDGTTNFANSDHGETDGIPIPDLLAMKTLAGPNKAVVFAGSPTTGWTDVSGSGPAGDGSAGTNGFPGFGTGTLTPAVCRLGDGSAGCGGVAVKQFGLPKFCDPTGIALGAGTDIGVMCRSGEFGTRLDFLIVNRSTGAITATVPGGGGGDQVAYDATSAKYYLANSRATANGKSCFQGGNQACNLTPHLTVVSGTAPYSVVGNFDSGNNAHSVAANGVLGVVLMPFSNTSATAGGANFPNGGVAWYPTM
jgi:hypothetical protein